MAVKNDEEINRAAQFLPFDALKGLAEELQERIDRRNRVSRRELSEEDSAAISAALMRIDAGSMVRLDFYEDGKYIEVEGMIDARNDAQKCVIIGEKKIFYDDICYLVVL